MRTHGNRRHTGRTWRVEAAAAWCTISLLAIQSYVLAEARIDTLWSRILITAALPATVAAIVLLLPERLALRLAWIVVAVVSLCAEADLLHFRYFGDLVSAPVLLAMGQIGPVLPSARDGLRLTDAWMLLNVVLPPLIVWQLPRRSHGTPTGPSRPTRLAVTLCATTMAVAGAVQGGAMPGVRLDQQFSHVTVAQEYGLLWFHALDAYRYLIDTLRPVPVDPALERHAARWLVETRTTRAPSGALAGALAGRSVVIVVVESLQAFAAELDVDGQPVMPVLRRLRNQGLWFGRVLDQSADGRTSDAELMLAASLLPLESGAAAFRYPARRFVTLPSLLRDAGYETVLAVPYSAGFWNRAVTHRAYGMSRGLFDRDFAPGRHVGWGLNDRDFLTQMAGRIAAMPHPLHATLITLSLHHPYDDFPADLKIGQMGRHEGTALGNYLHAMRFFDAALGNFVGQLDGSGILDRTVIVVLGDHDAGFSWSRSLADLIRAGNPVTWLLHDRVPLLILAPGSTVPARDVDVLGGQVDVPPTLAALLGVGSDALPFIGRNLLGAPGEAPVPLPNGQWASEHHAWISAGRETGCYDIPTRQRVGGEVCAAEADIVAQTRAASRAMLVHDLQARLAARPPTGN